MRSVGGKRTAAALEGVAESEAIMRGALLPLVFCMLGCSATAGDRNGSLGSGGNTGRSGTSAGGAAGAAGAAGSSGASNASGTSGGTASGGASGGAAAGAGGTGAAGAGGSAPAGGAAGSLGSGGESGSAPTDGGSGVSGLGGAGGGPTGGTSGTSGVGGAGASAATGGTGGTSGGTNGASGIGAAAGAGGAGGSECRTTSPIPGSVRSPTRKIKDLTGVATSSGRFGVGGTDLGIAVRQPNGKIAYIFGDTFEQDGVGGPGWRAPVLLRSEPGFDADGIDFNGAAGGSYAKQILDYRHDNQTTWLPSDALTIGSRMYLHYIVNQGLGNVQWTQIAYSDDNGENWTPSAARWEATENDSLRQLWTWERGCDGYVYTLSTKFISRDRGIILHRVPEAKILDRNAYEPWGYRANQWAWGNPATPVLEGAFGELSLRRVQHKWVLAWFNARDYEITIKVFDSPTSNLYNAATYHPIRGGDWCQQNDTTVAQLYGGYIHPDSTLHNLHLIVSQWNTGTGPCHTVQNIPYRAMEFVTGVE